MNQYPAKRAIYIKNRLVRRSKRPPIPTRNIPPGGAYQRPQGQESQLRVRQIRENLIEEEQEEQNDTKLTDPEAALCIEEPYGDWADVNHIALSLFLEIKNTKLELTQSKEIWIKTSITNKFKIHCSKKETK